MGQAALWGGISLAVMQFICGPVIGGLSDRFGRRPVLLIALIIMAFGYILLAVTGTVWLLAIGQMTGGVTAATQSTASADISKPEDKSANFGLIGAAFGIGFILGSLMGAIGRIRRTRTCLGRSGTGRGQCNIWVFCASRSSHRSH